VLQTDSDLEQLNDLMLNLLIIITRDARREQATYADVLRQYEANVNSEERILSTN